MVTGKKGEWKMNNFSSWGPSDLISLLCELRSQQRENFCFKRAKKIEEILQKI